MLVCRSGFWFGFKRIRWKENVSQVCWWVVPNLFGCITDTSIAIYSCPNFWDLWCVACWWPEIGCRCIWLDYSMALVLLYTTEVVVLSQIWFQEFRAWVLYTVRLVTYGNAVGMGWYDSFRDNQIPIVLPNSGLVTKIKSINPVYPIITHKQYSPIHCQCLGETTVVRLQGSIHQLILRTLGFHIDALVYKTLA